VEVDGKSVEYDGRQAIIATVLDVTEGKQIQSALEDANRRLHDALSEIRATQPKLIDQERLHALSTLASGIAHDLNNALSPILGYSELLLTKSNTWEDRDKVMRYLTTMSMAAKDAANVVRRLREVYRRPVEREDMAPVDVAQLVEQAVSLTSPKWKGQSEAHGAQINVQSEVVELPPILGNETELREALMNLIFNAVDAMPDGGSLTVRGFMEEPDATREETAVRTNGGASQSDLIQDRSNRVVLTVSDTGMGMADSVLKQCMEPFFTTKGEYGTGLGLPMVRGIVHRHLGTLEVKSFPGEGTTFSIRLPIPAPQDVASSDDEPESPVRSLHVLLVEDEPNVLAMLVAYLESDGHVVGAACDGLEGFETFLSDRYDVVITDLAMPGMSGDQLAQSIYRLKPETPIIMLTGFSDQHIEGSEFPEGVRLIVNKPVTLATLRSALVRVFARPESPSQSRE
jgi:signal transduction histidine kinase/ActR/RegA family two-component response regulator